MKEAVILEDRALRSGYASTMRRCPGLLALALLFVGCSSDSPSNPTAPESDPPAATVVFAGSASLDPYRTRIDALLQDAARRAGQRISVGAVTFTVSDDAARSIPGWGIGGYTFGPNEIEIVVDTGFGNLESVLDERLPPIAAHEIHHAVRWRSLGPGDTLLEGLVLEGLADHFALEVYGHAPPPWLSAFSESERDRYAGIAEPELDEPFTYTEWFFGQGPRNLPVWMGYTLGFLMVEDVLVDRGTNAGALVNEPAASFDPR